MSKYLNKFYMKVKTKRFRVISKSNGDVLAIICWYGAWRQYCFSPCFETIWNKDCLNTIENFLQQLMDERKIMNTKVCTKCKGK